MRVQFYLHILLRAEKLFNWKKHVKETQASVQYHQWFTFSATGH